MNIKRKILEKHLSKSGEWFCFYRDGSGTMDGEIEPVFLAMEEYADKKTKPLFKKIDELETFLSITEALLDKERAKK